MSEGKSAPAEVTAFIVEWIRARQGEGWTVTKIAKHLSVSRAQIHNMLDGSRGAGAVVENNFATKEFGGSVDALRKAARESQAQTQLRRAEELPPNLRSAAQMLATVKQIPPPAMEKARRVAAQLGDNDLDIETWIAVLSDLARPEKQRSSPPAPLAHPTKRSAR